MVLFWMSTAQALQLAVPFDELCARADRVVLAEATSRDVHWTADGNGLQTHTHLVELAPLDASYEVVTQGGTLPSGHHHWVEDQAHLPLDVPVVVLLAQTGETWRVVGGDQGVIPVSSHDQAEAVLEVCRD